MEAWALCPASHLARYPLRRRLDQEYLPPKIPRTRDLLLVIRVPLVSTPATNRARTLRKRIPGLETGIATVRQAYDGRPVRPRCRLLGCFLGRKGLSCHFSFLPSALAASLIPGQISILSILFIMLQLYTTEGQKARTPPSAWRISPHIPEWQLYWTARLEAEIRAGSNSAKRPQKVRNHRFQASSRSSGTRATSRPLPRTSKPSLETPTRTVSSSVPGTSSRCAAMRPRRDRRRISS